MYAFVVPGQGFQTPGMLAGWLRRDPVNAERRVFGASGKPAGALRHTGFDGRPALAPKALLGETYGSAGALGLVAALGPGA